MDCRYRRRYANHGKKDGGENNVKKQQNGRESLRRLKNPTVGCNASKRRKKKEEEEEEE
jgi:hypothetical protein